MIHGWITQMYSPPCLEDLLSIHLLASRTSTTYLTISHTIPRDAIPAEEAIRTGQVELISRLFSATSSERILFDGTSQAELDVLIRMVDGNVTWPLRMIRWLSSLRCCKHVSTCSMLLDKNLAPQTPPAASLTDFRHCSRRYGENWIYFKICCPNAFEH